MKKLLLLALVAAAVVFSVKDSFAASDGQVGATSTGTANINLNLPKLIRIRGMADANFGPYSGSGDLSFNKDVNISVNYASAGYKIQANGSGTENAFTVADGSSTVAYSVKFNDQVGTTGSVALTKGTDLTGQTGAVRPLGSSTSNGNYEIKFSEAALQAADAGSYTGVLTLVVTPE